MAAFEDRLSERMQDEIWMIMHMVAEMGALPEDKQYNNWRHECDVEELSDVETIGDTVHDGPNDDDDDSEDEKQRVLNIVDGKLKLLGDNLDAERACNELVKDFVDYFRKKSDAMKEPVLLKNGKPNDILFSSGIGSTMYSYFRSRLENFLGTSESLSKIVLVSSITKGVAYGLRESSSDSVNLVASLATKFISDKYGNFLSQNGGMTKLVLEAS